MEAGFFKEGEMFSRIANWILKYSISVFFKA